MSKRKARKTRAREKKQYNNKSKSSRDIINEYCGAFCMQTFTFDLQKYSLDNLYLLSIRQVPRVRSVQFGWNFGNRSDWPTSNRRNRSSYRIRADNEATFI